MHSDPLTVVPYLRPHLARVDITDQGDGEYLAKIVVAHRERVKILKEQGENSRYPSASPSRWTPMPLQGT